MERKPLDSKAIRSAGYDPDKQVLEVEFSSGRIYQYLDVAPETYAWLQRVPNKGAFVSRLLVAYDYHDVTDPPPEQDLTKALEASVEVTAKKRS